MLAMRSEPLPPTSAAAPQACAPLGPLKARGDSLLMVAPARMAVLKAACTARKSRSPLRLASRPCRFAPKAASVVAGASAEAEDGGGWRWHGHHGLTGVIHKRVGQGDAHDNGGHSAGQWEGRAGDVKGKEALTLPHAAGAAGGNGERNLHAPQGGQYAAAGAGDHLQQGGLHEAAAGVLAALFEGRGGRVGAVGGQHAHVGRKGPGHSHHAQVAQGDAVCNGDVDKAHAQGEVGGGERDVGRAHLAREAHVGGRGLQVRGQGRKAPGGDSKSGPGQG